jgi:hypothetical protein
MEPNIDYIGKEGAQGALASNILANGKMDPGQLRPWIGKDGKAYVTVFKGGDAKDTKNYVNHLVAHGTLRRDEWKQLDEAVVKISESRTGGVADLESHGLVYNLGNAMGTTVLEWHDVSDALSAELTMDGIARAQNDRPVYSTNYLPIPIIHADYEINTRTLAASRNMGNPLDTTLAERATRKVALKLEQMLFTNTSYAFGGGTIYSYTNYTNRNEVTLSLAWDDSSKTAAQILADVIAMKQASIDAYHYGPWMLYIPTSYETVMDEDYSTSGASTQTIRERIEKLGGIKGIKVIDTLTADNVLLVQMTSDVVRLVKGMPIQNIQWDEEGKFINKYKVMTIQVPQIRADQDGNCGITHLA